MFLNFSYPCRPLSDGDNGGNLSTAQRRPPLIGLHVRFIRSVSLKMLNVDHLGCADSVPLSESKNGFLIRDLPDFAVERNVKSEIGFVTLVTFPYACYACVRNADPHLKKILPRDSVLNKD